MILAEIPQQTFYEIPAGAAGTRATLRIMSRLVKETRTDPRIRGLAQQLIQHCELQGYLAEVNECFVYVRDNIRYTLDTNGTEVIHNPIELLDARQGDCDDKATLLAALLESIGHPCRFVALGYEYPGQYEHVYLETRIGNQWVACETTPIDGQSVDLGWYPQPPNISQTVAAKMIEHI